MSTPPAKRPRTSGPTSNGDTGVDGPAVDHTAPVNETPHTPESLAALLTTASRTDILALLLDAGVAHPDVAESVEAFASNLGAPAPGSPGTDLHVPAQAGAVQVTDVIAEAVPTPQQADLPAASGSGENQVPGLQTGISSIDKLREHDFKRYVTRLGCDPLQAYIRSSRCVERASNILALFRVKGRFEYEVIKPYMAVIDLDISDMTDKLDQQSSYAHKFTALKHLTEIFLIMCPQGNEDPSRMIRAVCEIEKWGRRLTPIRKAFTQDDCVRLAAEDGGRWLRDTAAEIERSEIRHYGVLSALKKTYSVLRETADARV